jgi:hypothetical protein
MRMIDVHKLATGLVERVQERLTWSARRSYILLFVVFDVMFCASILLSLQNVELGERNRHLIEENRQLESTVISLVVRVTEEPHTPTSTSTVTPSNTPSPTSMPPTVPTATLEPPSSTHTSVPLTPTDTPILPTLTSTSTPTPTLTPTPTPPPEPKSKPKSPTPEPSPTHPILPTPVPRPTLLPSTSTRSSHNGNSD